jgi:hypothetical protein
MRSTTSAALIGVLSARSTSSRLGAGCCWCCRSRAATAAPTTACAVPWALLNALSNSLSMAAGCSVVCVRRPHRTTAPLACRRGGGGRVANTGCACVVWCAKVVMEPRELLACVHTL